MSADNTHVSRPAKMLPPLPCGCESTGKVHKVTIHPDMSRTCKEHARRFMITWTEFSQQEQISLDAEKK